MPKGRGTAAAGGGGYGARGRHQQKNRHLGGGIPYGRIRISPNQADIARQSLSFNEASTCTSNLKLEFEFGPKTGRDRRMGAPSDWRWPNPSSGARPPYRPLACLTGTEA